MQNLLYICSVKRIKKLTIMKTIYTSLLGLMLSIPMVFCESILRPATTWYGVTKIVSPFTNVRYQSTAYELRGDTIINDTTYHSLWRDNGIYCAGIRQTANGQQVYIRPTQELMRDPYWESGEHLLYDFAVQVGDTVWAFDGSYSGIDNIGEDLSIQYRWIVKSVQNIDGRKHVLVEGGQMHNHQVEWIEGIGTKYIFFENTYEDALYNSYTAYALCAADSEGNIIYSFNTDELGIRNNCPDWEATSIEEVKEDIPSGPAYDVLGRPVDANYRGIVIQGGKKMVW